MAPEQAGSGGWAAAAWSSGVTGKSTDRYVSLYTMQQSLGGM